MAFRTYEALYAGLRAAFNDLPRDNGDIERVAALAEQLEQAAQAFDFDVPAEVKQFLEAVLSVNGAPLTLLTPGVRLWLEANGSLENLRHPIDRPVMSADEIFLLATLDRIEQCEARLLTWGLVDGFLSSEEMSAIVDPMLDDPQYADGLNFVSVAAVIEALKDRALLFDVGEEPDSRYRSRMAEAVRLLFRLRQLFPQHRGLIGWQSAPTLVADFRFIWRRRRYPRRGVSAREA